MSTRAVAATIVIALGGIAAADSLGGFSGVDTHYLVNQDRVCEPLEVTAGAATGAPACEKAAADAIARLSIKAGIVQRGDKATFSARASGRTLVVANQAGDAVATWEAPDPIAKVIEVYASQYGDRVAVAYAVRRAGRDMTDVVAFRLVAEKKKPDVGVGAGSGSGSGSVAPVDAKLTAAIEAARKNGKKPAWDAVLALDNDNVEARYYLAALAAPKQKADALVEIEKIAASQRADAIEWLVAARFDAAFAGLRSDAKFRAAVGLDRKATTTYERVMGFGGQWIQTGTSCDRAEVHLAFVRERTFKLRVKTACQGGGYDIPFKGTWRIDGNEVVIVVPTKGKQATAADEGRCKLEPQGDEDALHCALGRDVEFVALPTRR
jgi:hypothetical protein